MKLPPIWQKDGNYFIWYIEVPVGRNTLQLKVSQGIACVNKYWGEIKLFRTSEPRIDYGNYLEVGNEVLYYSGLESNTVSAAQMELLRSFELSWNRQIEEDRQIMESFRLQFIHNGELPHYD